MSQHIYFTSIHAVKIYEKFNNYTFQATVPGQLLARRLIKSNKKDEKNRKLYSTKHWQRLWQDMYYLQKQRNLYDETIEDPKVFEAPDINSEYCYNIIIEQ